jgi:hypothetical protein
MKYLNWIDYSFRKGGEWTGQFSFHHFTRSPNSDPVGVNTPPACYDVPNSSARVFDISAPTRNQVNVAVEDRLARRITRVNPHVEARNRRIDALQPPAGRG